VRIGKRLAEGQTGGSNVEEFYRLIGGLNRHQRADRPVNGVRMGLGVPVQASFRLIGTCSRGDKLIGPLSAAYEVNLRYNSPFTTPLEYPFHYPLIVR
jgi:hypothetical protein